MKSARSKACDISAKVKNTVWERDNGCCIICGRQGMPNAHYISRQRGGLGVEQNIVTLCFECHQEYDYGNRQTKENIGYMIREYLSAHYPDFDEKKLYFKKWSDISE